MNQPITISSKAFQKLIESYRLIEELPGRVGDRILKYSKPDKNIVYVKIGQGESAISIENEHDRLKWLNEFQDTVRVPKVEFFIKEDNKAALIISNLEGKSSHEMVTKLTQEEIIGIIAKSLQDLHSIDVSKTKEFRNTIKNMVSKYENLLSRNLISIENFKIDNDGKSPEEVLNYLKVNINMFDESVFVHGDFCLPNIIIDNNKSFGLIDWSNAGISDRYMDFSSVEGSIKRNFGEKFIDLFYVKYGVDPKSINREKIRYFQLIDQFSYNRIDPNQLSAV